MTTLVLYSFLTASLYYLLARAEITSFLWSRYPNWLDNLLMCAACSGFWYGLLVGVLGFFTRLPFLGLNPRAWYTIPIVGLCSIIWTPLMAAAFTKALLYVSPHVEVREGEEKL